MLHEVTPLVSWTLQGAQVLAQHQGSTEIGPHHLLHALLQEEEGQPFLLLVKSGLEPAHLQQFIQRVPQGESSEDPSLSLSPAAQHIFHQARSLARELAFDPTISSEHLLLALLQEEASLCQSLEPLGFIRTNLEALVISSLASPPLEMEEPLNLDDVTEKMERDRILDANANRAREAIRVLEDYCRFGLDDAGLSAELKSLRHDLVSTLEEIPGNHFLISRDTLADVGTTLSAPAEKSRFSLQEVVQANTKRLQESLRSLEEYGKLHSPALGQALEQIRYRAYTLERMLLSSQYARERLADVFLCVLVTGSQCWGSLEWTVREAIEGGAGMIQLREKNLTDQELWQRARQVRRWTQEAGALFIMNDRPDIARLVGADGVHLGQEDLPIKEARRILGPETLIGVSTHDLDQVRQAVREGASYIGVGPTFPSQTKEFTEFPGLDLLKRVSQETTLPAFAIGGITLANLPEVIDAGGRRVAVSGSLCRNEAPQALAKAMSDLLKGANHQ